MLPFFYIRESDEAQQEITLDEATSRHIVQVLRMPLGAELNLTEGKGSLMTAEIVDAHRKRCRVRIKQLLHIQPPARTVSIGISLLKNPGRFEWFLEKAAELGVSGIIPLLCERTEKQSFRKERMEAVLVSALLQSRQCWLPVLHQPARLLDLLPACHQPQKFIAHCIEDEKRNLADLVNENLEQIVLVGPEGDFTPEEVALAVKHHFVPVMLGDTRLRSETAGIAAACLLRLL
ncbi:MAG TPA: RsmE family RNA methyltransferase [Chitinophagaceae bacterium]|nr:RsmE family RNA methyltransferase [Chitinophagaceae bacterium]